VVRGPLKLLTIGVPAWARLHTCCTVLPSGGRCERQAPLSLADIVVIMSSRDRWDISLIMSLASVQCSHVTLSNLVRKVVWKSRALSSPPLLAEVLFSPVCLCVCLLCKGRVWVWGLGRQRLCREQSPRWSFGVGLKPPEAADLMYAECW